MKSPLHLHLLFFVNWYQLLPHHLHSIFLKSASELAPELEEEEGKKKALRSLMGFDWFVLIRTARIGFHIPWKPRSMKCWAHCTFSVPIFWSTYKFWNIHRNYFADVCGTESLTSFSFLLTCKGCIPAAMRSLIIRTWPRAFGSVGRRRGPGLVSSIYWITASYVSKMTLSVVFKWK